MKNLPPKEDADPKTANLKKAVKHTAESLQIFKDMKIAAPMTLGDIPEILKALEAKMGGVKEKAAKWDAEMLVKKEKAEAQKKELGSEE